MYSSLYSPQGSFEFITQDLYFGVFIFIFKVLSYLVHCDE